MRGVDSTLYPIQRRHGGGGLRAGILPAHRQERPPQPPLRNTRPTQDPPRLSLCFTPTFTAPEGVRIILRIAGRALQRRPRDLFAKYAADTCGYLAKRIRTRTESARPTISHF